MRKFLILVGYLLALNLQGQSLIAEKKNFENGVYQGMIYRIFNLSEYTSTIALFEDVIRWEGQVGKVEVEDENMQLTASFITYKSITMFNLFKKKEVKKYSNEKFVVTNNNSVYRIENHVDDMYEVSLGHFELKEGVISWAVSWKEPKFMTINAKKVLEEVGTEEAYQILTSKFNK